MDSNVVSQFMDDMDKRPCEQHTSEGYCHNCNRTNQEEN